MFSVLLISQFPSQQFKNRLSENHNAINLFLCIPFLSTGAKMVINLYFQHHFSKEYSACNLKFVRNTPAMENIVFINYLC